MGATTIWERWDSMLPDGAINPGEMTSFNHYALGAVADWMHRTVGGIAPASPGYCAITIAPRPGGGITQCHTRHLTPYGPVQCEWQIVDDLFEMNISIPPNTTARIFLPGREHDPIDVGSGEWNWSIPYHDPDARGPYTVDDITGEILGDSAAKRIVLELLDRLNAPGFLRAIMLKERNMPLREVLRMLPNYEVVVDMMNQALAGEME
jgi:alpha-L-rhamnosidase